MISKFTSKTNAGPNKKNNDDKQGVAESSQSHAWELNIGNNKHKHCEERRQKNPGIDTSSIRDEVWSLNTSLQKNTDEPSPTEKLKRRRKWFSNHPNSSPNRCLKERTPSKRPNRVLTTGNNKNLCGKQINGGIDISCSQVISRTRKRQEMEINDGSKSNTDETRGQQINKCLMEDSNLGDNKCTIRGLDAQKSCAKAPSLDTGHNINKGIEQKNGHIKVSGKEGSRNAAEYDIIKVGHNENDVGTQENGSINMTS